MKTLTKIKEVLSDDWPAFFEKINVETIRARGLAVGEACND
jgi:hypothetical protein